MTVAEVLDRARVRYEELAALGEYNAMAGQQLELYKLIIGLGEAVQGLEAGGYDDLLLLSKALKDKGK